MSKVLIIGGGAAGMMAGIAAGYNGNEVHIFEKNEKLGKKLFITGKGRCNITNASSIENHFANILKNEKFLYSAIYTFDNHATMDYFEQLGLKMKTERGNRVFPQSDHASDVIRVLTEELRRKKVCVCLNTKVREILSDGTKVTGLRWDCHDTHQKNQVSEYDAVVVACGGVSYPTSTILTNPDLKLINSLL